VLFRSYHGWVYFNEAKRCVNHSRYKTCIIDDDIFIGFIHIQHLETKIGQFIAPERKRNGPFTGLEDFLKRVPSGLEQMLILIRTGAFRFTGKSKAQLLWQVHLLLGKNVEDKHHNALFSVPQKKFILPKLEHNPLEDAYDELDIFGFPVSMSDFDMLKTGFRGETMARDLKKHVGKTVRMVGNMVTIKYVKTVKREIMHFGTFLDTTGDFFDTTHFPNSLKYYPFKGRGVYLLLGKIVEEFGFPGMEVQKMAKLPFKADPRE
jgi:DNA polymerase III alpha subunit